MNPTPLVLAVGRTVGIRGTNRRCIITQIVSGSRVGVQDTGSERPPEEIEVRFLCASPPADDALKATAPAAAKARELNLVTEQAWATAKWRLMVITPFVGVHRPPAKLVKARAREHGVHYTTVYHWIAIYRNSGGKLSSLVNRPRSVPKGTEKLADKVKAIVKKAIKDHYLTPQRKRVKTVWESIKIECEKEGIPLERTSRTQESCVPHINTVRAWILAMSGLKREQPREDPSKVSKYTVSGEGFVARFPLEYVQIDHTLINVVLVEDGTGRVLGRPWITLAIDVFSRVIVGYYISFDSPGALAVGLCLSMAILPKDSWLERHASAFAELKHKPEWPCWGKPVHVHTDNGRDFRGDMLKRACDQYGIHTVFRPVRKPHFGAHIESMMDTLAKAFEELPGKTFANTVKRGKNYDPEKEAALTFSEFEGWLANLICVEYHYRVHSSLGMSPIDRWHQAYQKGTEYAPALGALPDRYEGESAVQLEMDFLPMEFRKVTEAGIVIDKIRYMDAALRKWINAKDPDDPKKARDFIIRYDPRDLSFVYFWDPDENCYKEIRYRDLSRPAVTLWEVRAAKEFLADKRNTPKGKQDEAMIFSGVKMRRNVIEEAAARKGKMKAAGKFRGGGIHDHRRRNRNRPGSSGKSPLPEDVPALADKMGCAETYAELEVWTDGQE